MADRLAELRRQRALLQVHLAWLDREITRAGGDPTTGSFPPFGSTPSTAPFLAGSKSPLPAPSSPTAGSTPAQPAEPAPTAAATASATTPKASVPSASPAEPSALPGPTPPTTSAAASPTTLAKPDADALLSQFRREPEAVRRDVRQGCLLYFVGALVLLALGVAGLYFAFRAS